MGIPDTRAIVNGTDALIITNALADSLELKISSGQVEGYSFIDKFGKNSLITTASDPEDIWDQGGVYTYTSNLGADYYFSSSSISDTQNIRFNVLTVDSNGNWNDEEIEQVIVGQTKTKLITTSGDKIVRIYRMQNIGSVDIAGVFYCYEDVTVTLGVPTDVTKIRAIINGSVNQTLMTIYTIPTGKVGFLYKGEAGMIYTGSLGSGNNFARITYKSRRPGEVFKVKKDFSILSQASSNYVDIRSFPDPIPSKTDVKVTCEQVSEDMGIWSAVDFLLIDEELLSDEFLTSIGQVKRVI